MSANRQKSTAGIKPEREFPFPMTTPASTPGKEGGSSGRGSDSRNPRSYSPTAESDRSSTPRPNGASPARLSPGSSPPVSTVAADATLRRSSTTFKTTPLGPIRPNRPLGRRDSLLSEFASASMDEMLEKAPQTPSWHSIPLAFAVLPAVAGVLVKGASHVVTDFLLLVLAAIVLRWVVKVPWEWYLSSQPPSNSYSSPSSAIVDEDLEPSSTGHARVLNPSTTSAQLELARHNQLALMFCFLGPLLGGILLHTIRAQLSRPSEGLISNFNLTVFVLAAELRPVAQAINLIRGRSIYLQSNVQQQLHQQQLLQQQQTNSDATPGLALATTAAMSQYRTEITALTERVHALEDIITQYRHHPPQTRYLPTPASSMGSSRDYDSELEALTRAVRRYEKRDMHNDERIRDVESRLDDVLSLAAAAAVVKVEEEERRKQGFLRRCWNFWLGGVWALVRCAWDVGIVGPVSMLDWALGTVGSAKDGGKRSTIGIGAGNDAWMDKRRKGGEGEREKDRRGVGVRAGHPKMRMKVQPLSSGRRLG